MTPTENTTMHAGKRRFARLSLIALGFLLACGETTAPVAPVAKPAAPVVLPDLNLVDIANGLLNVSVAGVANCNPLGENSTRT